MESFKSCSELISTHCPKREERSCVIRFFFLFVCILFRFIFFRFVCNSVLDILFAFRPRSYPTW